METFQINQNKQLVWRRLFVVVRSTEDLRALPSVSVSTYGTYVLSTIVQKPVWGNK